MPTRVKVGQVVPAHGREYVVRVPTGDGDNYFDEFFIADMLATDLELRLASMGRVNLGLGYTCRMLHISEIDTDS